MKMGFGDLSASAGLQSLNSFLATKSYIDGYVPSQADAVVFDSLKSAPAGELYPHAQRWYKHITSYGAEKSSFPGEKKSLESYGPGGNAAEKSADPDDDFDLFGSDGDDDDAEKIKQDRLAAYDAKKKAKPGPIAKSGLVLDVKPWDDETDMKKVEECVRSIVMDGLLWGTSKLVPVGYGIKKLQIAAVIEDDKISTETLEEEITAFEDYIQSMDIAAFNKI